MPTLTPPPPTDIAVFGRTNFRGQLRPFGIKTDDRRRHMYVIGKTGMGKSTLLENMIVQDIRAGRGLAFVDPHGDTVEKLLDYIPSYRMNDVVYFNPSDVDFPIAFNVLESINATQRALTASGLVSIFKKIWADSWGPRLEYILRNTILALVEYPGSTLLGVTRMLVDRDYQRKVVASLSDPIVKAFWQTEFNGYEQKFRTEAVAPIQNKIGQFLSSSVIRNIVGQPKSTIDMREIMDSGKILLLNLSKGRIGEDNAALLGAMMITKIQLAAMSRIDIPEKERRDFFLYVDEFQNFATESFANILSEARKYHLDLIMAHQYIEQLDETVRAAVFGNVGTIITFRVGATDAEFLAKEYMPIFTETDLVNLTKFDMYLKLMIDGVASEPFSASGLPPVLAQAPEGLAETVAKVSRERYAKTREIVEEKITRWSGVEETMMATAAAENRFQRRSDQTRDEEPVVYERAAPVVTENIPEPISLSQALQAETPRAPRPNNDRSPRPPQRPDSSGRPRRHRSRSAGNRRPPPSGAPSPDSRMSLSSLPPRPEKRVEPPVQTPPPITPPPAPTTGTTLTPGQVVKI